MSATPQQRVQFAQTLRRLLYVSKILQFEAQGMLSDTIAPKYLKTAAKGLENAINRLFTECKCNTNIDTWDKVKADIDSEQIYDLHLMIDFLSNIKNVGEILEVLKEHVGINILQ